jgi:hypothetical protein
LREAKSARRVRSESASRRAVADAETPQGLIVNLYNAMHDPMTVSIG